jgi:hypothetical protein
MERQNIHCLQKDRLTTSLVYWVAHRRTIRKMSQNAPSSSTRFWDEGLYLWTGKGRWAGQQKTEQMMLDLLSSRFWTSFAKTGRNCGKNTKNSLNANQQSDEQPLLGAQWWGPLVPPKTLEDAGYVVSNHLSFLPAHVNIYSSPSILIPLPPDVPSIWEKIDKLLAPSHRALAILHESVASGEQKAFALRIWEKARSEEPFILAKRTIAHTYEQWKKRDESEEDDQKKGST